MSSGEKGLIISLNETGMDYALEKAYEVIKRGGIISYPTETLYGLGVRYDSVESIERLLKIKKRPEHKGIPLIIGTTKSLNLIVRDIPLEVNQLMERFWPGPLTILFDAREELSPLLTGDTRKIAVRIPGKSFAYELVSKYELIITATSANPAGLPPAHNIIMVKKYFNGLLDLMIDGGVLMGKPSTIIEFQNGRLHILREGKITASDILRVCGKISFNNKQLIKEKENE